jgi:hypothetical protein
MLSDIFRLILPSRQKYVCFDHTVCLTALFMNSVYFLALCPYSAIPYESREVTYDADHCLVTGSKYTSNSNIPCGVIQCREAKGCGINGIPDQNLK